MFSCEFYEIFKNTFFTEHLWTTASVSFEPRFLMFSDRKSKRFLSLNSLFFIMTDRIQVHLHILQCWFICFKICEFIILFCWSSSKVHQKTPCLSTVMESAWFTGGNAKFQKFSKVRPRVSFLSRRQGNQSGIIGKSGEVNWQTYCTKKHWKSWVTFTESSDD